MVIVYARQRATNFNFVDFAARNNLRGVLFRARARLFIQGRAEKQRLSVIGVSPRWDIVRLVERAYCSLGVGFGIHGRAYSTGHCPPNDNVPASRGRREISQSLYTSSSVTSLF